MTKKTSAKKIDQFPKINISDVSHPVVNNPVQAFFNLFKSFVLVGGDLV